MGVGCGGPGVVGHPGPDQNPKEALMDADGSEVAADADRRENQAVANHALKVWWIPQVPGQAFEVAVPSVAVGRLVCDVLADYDQFQFDHNIKPDYSNAGGVAIFVDGEWWDCLPEDDDADWVEPT